MTQKYPLLPRIAVASYKPTQPWTPGHQPVANAIAEANALRDLMQMDDKGFYLVLNTT